MSENEAINAPKCVGIIMDGNRRWAKANGRPLYDGHKVGYEKLKEVLRWSKEKGVKDVIVFAFSSENWNRAADEVGYLMDLMRFVFKSEVKTLEKEKVRVRFAGDLSRLPKDIQEEAKKTLEKTADGEVTLTLCVSYGGRAEILNAAKKLLEEKFDPSKLTEEEFSSRLYTAGTPDPDLVIRTSGEERLSGFLPWQTIYSELFFTKTLWPDLSKEEYLDILKKFGERTRRLGK